MATSIENFNYIISAGLTPLFLVAGTFFPLDQLPEWAQTLAQFNPLYHLVQLVRHAAFGFDGWADAGHVGGADRVRPAHVAAGDLAPGEAARRLRRLTSPAESKRVG